LGQSEEGECKSPKAKAEADGKEGAAEDQTGERPCGPCSGKETFIEKGGNLVSFRQQCMIFWKNHALLPKAYEI